MTFRILLVEDDDSCAQSLISLLGTMGHHVDHALDLTAARPLATAQEYDWMLLDLMLPDGNGLELLSHRGAARVVVMTGDAGIRDSIRALEGPDLSFLIKPVVLRDLVKLLQTDAPALRKPSGDGANNKLLGDSSSIVQLRSAINRVGATDVPVFINGESGVGKELVAEAIHRASGRGGEFIALNCGATSPELLASQLFGHEKGSFTGAQGRHIGYFERAVGGTLFLDEITEMPIEQQPGLLRALESRRITRVGGSEELEVDVRIVSACNRDPEQAVVDGLLREDLLFRLAVFPIMVPPLRERGDDIDLLADHFLNELNESYGTDLRFSEQALSMLKAHHWPGNVRELRHVIQRAFILADPGGSKLEISEQTLRPFGARKADTIPVGSSIKDVEKALILKTLASNDGDKPQTAKVLGISLKTLYNRLNEYDAA